MMARRIHTASAIFARVVAGTCLLLWMACSSSEPIPPSAVSDGGLEGAAEGGCQLYASGAGNSTPVSFAADVLPIFQRSCALSASCHGDPGAGPLQPYLGSSGGVDAATLTALIVGVKSAEDPAMDLVAPKDPANSFLMHKMDGDQCALGQACAGTNYSTQYPDCGSAMPYLSPVLPVATRDTVRAWIMQGAK